MRWLIIPALVIGSLAGLAWPQESKGGSVYYYAYMSDPGVDILTCGWHGACGYYSGSAIDWWQNWEPLGVYFQGWFFRDNTSSGAQLQGYAQDINTDPDEGCLNWKIGVYETVDPYTWPLRYTVNYVHSLRDTYYSSWFYINPRDPEQFNSRYVGYTGQENTEECFWQGTHIHLSMAPNGVSAGTNGAIPTGDYCPPGCYTSADLDY